MRIDQIILSVIIGGVFLFVITYLLGLHSW